METLQTQLKPEELKRIILSLKEPVVIKNRLNWNLLKWSLEDWQALLKHEKLLFRCGKKSFTKSNQWERRCAEKKMSFEEFILFTKEISEEWIYFDYKYLREWFNTIDQLKKEINWCDFGFPELTAEDSTIWIGSESAHTPCHKDTYGCNLVAQIYGRKQWILCSPEEDLKSTRIPYEESSIYSSLNFFSPTIENFKGIKNCRKVILEPGDVLFVPHNWWHYVENLTTAISINVWIPMSVDHEERMNESLVQFFMAQIVKQLDKKTKEVVFNPNSDDMENVSLNTSLDVVRSCKDLFFKSTECKEMGLCMEEIDFYFEKYGFLSKTPILSDQDFLLFLQEQRNRFRNEDAGSDSEELLELINAFVHPDTVLLVRTKLLN